MPNIARRLLESFLAFRVPDHDLSVLSEAPVILREVLDLIRTCDADHFDGMSQLI